MLSKISRIVCCVCGQYKVAGTIHCKIEQGRIDAAQAKRYRKQMQRLHKVNTNA